MRLEKGNFGDYKNLGDGLSELRLTFGSGYRIYYTIEKRTIILIISGGDKTTQAKDIDNAKKYVKLLKELK
jgi:putative addiction module killer protein